MIFQKVTFDRLFPSALSGSGLMTSTTFGFEAAGKRYFSVEVPGRPRIEQGMTVIALLATPNGFHENNGLLGWVDCQDGSIICDSIFGYFGMFLLSTFWAIVFPFWARAAIATPDNANLAAFFIALLFMGFAFQALYFFAKALLVKRALGIIRDPAKQTTVDDAANTAVERGA